MALEVFKDTLPAIVLPKEQDMALHFFTAIRSAVELHRHTGARAAAPYFAYRHIQQLPVAAHHVAHDKSAAFGRGDGNGGCSAAG